MHTRNARLTFTDGVVVVVRQTFAALSALERWPTIALTRLLVTRDVIRTVRVTVAS